MEYSKEIITAIIGFVVVSTGGSIWALIKMFFENKELKSDINDFKILLKEHNSYIASLKKEITEVDNQRKIDKANIEKDISIKIQNTEDVIDSKVANTVEKLMLSEEKTREELSKLNILLVKLQTIIENNFNGNTQQNI